MKIAIDLRSLSEGRRSGVEEYVLNIVQSLLRIDKINKYYLFRSGIKDLFLANELLLSEKENTEERRIKIPNRILNFSLKVFHEPLLDLIVGKSQVFFMPNLNISPVSSRCKKIITFHDLSYEIYPEYFSLKRRLWHKFINPKKQAREAYKLIAISESTKNDLVNLYNIPSDTIKVIHSGISQKFQPIFWNDIRLARIKEKYRLPDSFILYLGAIEPRKNISGLIKAFNELKSTNKDANDIKLVIAGIRGWLYNEIIKTARESRYARDIIFTGFIDDRDKLFVYNLATLFIYPSFYEGFGFPPLEAMACGIPTITSNTSSLSEVVEDGAIMIDPYNIDEMVEAMQLLLYDQDLRSKLQKNGLVQAQKFSWMRTAEKTLQWLVE